MSFKLIAGDRKVLLMAGTVSFLLVAITALFSQGAARNDDTPTTYSSGSGGAKAAYLLLVRSGYQVRRWEQSVENLPSGDSRMWIVVEPQAAPTPAERLAIQRFIESGGRVIATGRTSALFLPDHLVQSDPLAGMTWQRIPALSPSSITRAANEIVLAPAAFWTQTSSGLPLYGNAERVYVVRREIGDGAVIWWASPTPLTNAGIREASNLEFFLANVGPPSGQILWDEYFHGYRSGVTATARSSWYWVGAPALLAGLAVLLTYSRRSGPIIVPPVESRLSPLEFVRTLGALYQRAGAASVAVDIAYQRFRYQVIRRVGGSQDATVEHVERAIHDRWSVREPAVGTLLRACETARHDPTLTPKAALSLTRQLWDLADGLRLFAREPETGGRPGRPDKENV